MNVTKGRFCHVQIRVPSPLPSHALLRNSHRYTSVLWRRFGDRAAPAPDRCHRFPHRRAVQNFSADCVSRVCRSVPAAVNAFLSISCAVCLFIATDPFLFREGNNGRDGAIVLYFSRCQAMRSEMARRPSEFTGTALEISPPLTMDLSKSRSVTGFWFW